MRISLSIKQAFEAVCLDTDYIITIIDRACLKTNRLDCEIHRTNVPLSFRGIDSKTYQSNKYVVIPFYIPEYIDEKIQLIEITAEVYIVDHLNVKILIDIEEIIIDFIHRSLIFGDVLNFRTDIYVHAKDNVKTRRVIKVAKDAIISSRSVIKISIKVKEDSEPLINNRDYFFKPDRSGGYYHLINTDLTRPYKNYVRYYVDDIIIIFKTFEQYIEHLDTIFELFDAPISLTFDDDDLI